MAGIKQSPWILHYDASSCNGCDIETLACLTPVFDVERLGVINTGNPKHADIFLVTGAVNEQSRDVIRNLYRQMPEPKVVIAIGACAATGGVFRECYNISGGVDSVIPVDVFVPGCAARPEAIIDGVVQALAVLEQRQLDTATAGGSVDQVLYLRAQKSNAPQILALQKAAYQSEAGIYGDEGFPALQQTLEELEDEFDRRPNREASCLGTQETRKDPEKTPNHVVFIKAVVNGRIIGAVRGYAVDDTAYLSRVIVHPYFQGMGIGRRLTEEIETAFPGVKRFEIFTGHRNERNLRQFRKLGYQEFKTEPFTPAIRWIYLQKERK